MKNDDQNHKPDISRFRRNGINPLLPYGLAALTAIHVGSGALARKISPPQSRPSQQYVALGDNTSEPSQDAINRQYVQIYEAIAKAKKAADAEGKTLSIIVGEEHYDDDPLLAEFMILDAAKRLGINALGIEFNIDQWADRRKTDQEKSAEWAAANKAMKEQVEKIIAEIKKFNPSADISLKPPVKENFTSYRPDYQAEFEKSIKENQALQELLRLGGKISSEDFYKRMDEIKAANPRSTYEYYLDSMLDPARDSMTGNMLVLSREAYINSMSFALFDPKWEITKEGKNAEREQAMCAAMAEMKEPYIGIFGAFHAPHLAEVMRRDHNHHVLCIDVCNLRVVAPKQFYDISPEESIARDKQLKKTADLSVVIEGRPMTGLAEAYARAFLASAAHQVKTGEVTERYYTQAREELSKRLGFSDMAPPSRGR